MIKVFQEIIDKGSGDCFSAALASLLELDISEVPKFRKIAPAPGDMMLEARAWCRDNFGLSIVSIQMEDINDPEFCGKDIRLIGCLAGTPCLAGGESPNFEGVNHCVVGEIDHHGMNFIMTHDPNPSGKGILGRPKHLYFLVPIDPPSIKRIKRRRQK